MGRIVSGHNVSHGGLAKTSSEAKSDTSWTGICW